MFDIFKKDICCICKHEYPVSALNLKENKYICNNCKRTFNTLNYSRYNIENVLKREIDNLEDIDLFEEVSFDKIKESIEKKESLHSIEFDKELKEAQIKANEKAKQRKEANNKIYQELLQNLKIIKPKISNIKTPKNMLKDMPSINFRSVTKTIPLNILDNFVVVDTETTGLQASKDEIIEISAIKFIDGIPIECLSTLIKPKKEISIETENIHHISNEMVANSPSIEYVIQDFSDFIENLSIVGYNLEFDVNFLYKNGMDFFKYKRKFYDMLPTCRKLLKEFNLANFKLDTVCNYLGFKRNNAHRSTDDALITGIIFRDFGHLIKDKSEL